jgi:hypothetical protein
MKEEGRRKREKGRSKIEDGTTVNCHLKTP